MNIQILVIDDDEGIRKLLKVLLKQTGYDLLEAGDADTAFGILRQSQSVQAVICDIKIHNVSGIQILEQIKRDFETLPVIMLTALLDLQVAIDAMRKGAFDFLTKPVKKDDLILVIEKALNYKAVLDENRRLRLQNQQYRERLGRAE